MHATDEILRAAAEWSWRPRGSREDLGELRLTHYPERLGGGVRASQTRSTLDAADVIAHALARSRGWGAAEITFWTNPSDAPDLEPELRRRGAVPVDAVAVLAAPVDTASVDVPGDVTVEVVRDLAQVRDADAVNVPVWAQEPLDERGLREELDDVTAALTTGAGIQVLARLDGLPVSVGGCTIIDGFVRLWGGATLPEARGRGAYRAVLAERIRLGAAHGARTALVKGRVATSAPILRRAGFTQIGEERAYRLAV